MAIFPVIKAEKTLQVDDKTRIDVSKSYADKGEAAITLVEIEPEASAGFINVTGTSSKDWFLDYQYSTEGAKVVSCRVTTDGLPTTVTKTINVVSAVNDKLFSDDNDLKSHEWDILKYLPSGKSSYNHVHRRAQEMIVYWFDQKGYVDSSGNKFTKDDFLDVLEVKEWSTFLVLGLIYEDLSNSVDDIFGQKSKMYLAKAKLARQKSVFRLDLDGSGVLDSSEGINISSVGLFRE